MLTMSLSQVPHLSNEDHNFMSDGAVAGNLNERRVLTYVKRSVNLAAVVFFT